ncbi:g11710 [Coccomyxa viridis]|uniref:G11710 protein n=1 Tax=Coccomyxa viridis TaxID=1274662 RepID=A0ABP1G8K4_9CHLO
MPLENEPPVLVQRLLRLRRLTDWSPVIVVAVLSSDQLHLALILATALSVGNILADLIFKLCSYIKVWPKYLDVCFFITYGVTLILSYTISDSFVHRWLQVITQGGVCLLITLGILCGRPFTADIAKETVPEQFWAMPGFRRTTYMLSWLWAAIFLIMTLSYVVVAAVGANGQHDNGLNIAFNYVIPIGFLVGGILFTKWYSAHVKSQREAAMQQAGSSSAASSGQPTLPKRSRGVTQSYGAGHPVPKAEV